MDVFDLFAKLSLDTSGYESGLSGALVTSINRYFNQQRVKR